MNVFRLSILSAILTSFVCAGAGAAQSLTEMATEAETKVVAGDVAGALAVSGQISAQIWDASPDIGIFDTLLVTQPSSGFGIYNPRPDDKFKLGDPIYVYAEPFGFGYGTPEDGLYSIDFAVDLRVLSTSGEVMGEVTDVAQLDVTTRQKIREFPANLTYTLNGIPAGRYVLETTLRDKNSAKTGLFQTEIELTD